MMDISESILIKALRREPTTRTPIWLMRQAGRYLPEYRQIRQRAGSFMNLCKTPELACEVALQPLRRYRLDAAILFSDILTIPDAMGLGLYFKEGEGPCFTHPLNDLHSIQQLPTHDILEKLEYVFTTTRLIRQAMPENLPLIGFAGSPWTLACYMMEGRSSREFKAMRMLTYKSSQCAILLLSKLTQLIIQYLQAQVSAGANILMLFDTWGGLLPYQQYLQFSLEWMQQIVQALQHEFPTIPIILFTKGSGHWLEAIADTGCDAISLDCQTSLTVARQQVGDRVALQGNIDPLLLHCADFSLIREAVVSTLNAYGPGSGHIMNLGHGITPDILPEHIEFLVETVHALSHNNC